MAFPLGNFAALRTMRVLRALKTVAVVPGLITSAFTLVIKLDSFQRIRKYRSVAFYVAWLRGPAVEHRSLAGVLSLSCVRLVADG